MSVPSTGQLEMKKLFKGIVIGAGNPTDYGSTSVTVLQGNISLEKMSTGITSHSSYPLNPSSNRPNGTAPHTMTEFYSYNADLAPTPPSPPPPGLPPKGGPPKSFTSDTMVTMHDGTYKRIDEIQTGDNVRVFRGDWTHGDWDTYDNIMTWSGSLEDSNVYVASSSVTEVVSESYSDYIKFEIWDVNPTKNTWEDGHITNKNELKASWTHPLLVKSKYDNPNGLIKWKPANQVRKGEELYISGSFVKIRTKETINLDEEQDLFNFATEDPSDTIVVNNIIAHDY